MDTIEKIKRYIELTKKPQNERYDMSIEEWFTINAECGELEAIALSFQYGRAKGYREAKAK